MQDHNAPSAPEDPHSERSARQLTGAALRALEEAEARRREYVAFETARPTEIGGRGGREPVRYGDWEVRGLASDF